MFYNYYRYDARRETRAGCHMSQLTQNFNVSPSIWISSNNAYLLMDEYLICVICVK